METLHTVISLLLALIFLISGLSKASGSAAGLSGTRDVGFPDGLARLVGIFETLAASSLVIGFALDNREDRKSTRLNSSHEWISRMPSSA